jgi:hypothetical protein
MHYGESAHGQALITSFIMRNKFSLAELVPWLFACGSQSFPRKRALSGLTIDLTANGQF